MNDGESTALVEVGYRPLAVTPQRQDAMSGYFMMSLRQGENAPPIGKLREFAAVAISLGLHPLAGEIMVYEGSLYVTIDGRRRLAMRHPDFAAIQPNIVTDPAIREAMQANRHGDVLAICHLYRKSTPIPSIQYGLVREAERYPSVHEAERLGVSAAQIDAARAAHNPAQIMDVAIKPEAKVRPVITQPAIMAMKRAEARALNIIAQVALPTYDPDTEAPIDYDPEGESTDVFAGGIEGEPSATPAADEGPPVTSSSPPPAHGGPGDEETAPARPPVDQPSSAPPARAARRPAPPAGQTREGAGGGLLNPPTNHEQLQRFAIQRLGFKNTADICNALGVKVLTDAKDLTGAWNDLCRLKGK